MKKRAPRIRTRGRRKAYGEMTTRQLAAETARFDREDLSGPVPLAGEKLRQYQQARSMRGRPRIGAGSKAITVTLERGLLARVDRIVRRRNITRSHLIATALLAQLTAAPAAE